jgi:undecaprenyl diphosphate synthase
MHVAIVMDGNGRWAQEQGQPRIFGHREGANAVRRAVEAARHEAIDVLTLFAFSSDNWGRPVNEVSALMDLFGLYLESETKRCRQNGIRLSVIGRRDRLPVSLVEAIHLAEERTAAGDHMLLRIAVDYSARDSIYRAARAVDSAVSREFFELAIQAVMYSVSPALDVDLLIRTGGEMRLSDFLLWECAYAELVFLKKMWPDFRAKDLRDAIGEFHSRNRRFGKVPVAANPPVLTPAADMTNIPVLSQ